MTRPTCRALGVRAVRDGIEASPRPARGALRRVDQREPSLHGEGWVTGHRAASRARPRLRAGRRASGSASTDVRGRQGPGPLIRSNGEPTYFAADVGYLLDKFSRGFDHLIYIWGADHHGYIARPAVPRRRWASTRTASRCCSPAGSLRSARRRWSPCRSGRATSTCSTRSSRDRQRRRALVLRLAWRQPDIEVDVDLAKKQSSENPVYYVQYAHARIASILRKAAEAGLSPAPSVAGSLAGAPEAALARAVAHLPEVVEDAVLGRGDADDHGVRDRAGDDLPRVLSRRAGGRPGRARALREAAGPRRGDEDHARQRAGIAWDLGAGLDVGPRPPAT